MVARKLRKPVALSLIGVLLLALNGLSAATAGSAGLHGVVLAADGATPRANVVVNLVDIHSESVISSSPSGVDGEFEILRAPAGSYRVVAEAGEGAYLAANNLRLESGENPAVLLALRPQAPASNAAAEPEDEPAEPEDQGDDSGAPTVKPPRAGMPTWGKWVLAGSLGITGILLIDEVSQDAAEASQAF